MVNCPRAIPYPPTPYTWPVASEALNGQRTLPGKIGPHDTSVNEEGQAAPKCRLEEGWTPALTPHPTTSPTCLPWSPGALGWKSTWNKSHTISRGGGARRSLDPAS